jgi:hypothetical protein
MRHMFSRPNGRQNVHISGNDTYIWEVNNFTLKTLGSSQLSAKTYRSQNHKLSSNLIIGVHKKYLHNFSLKKHVEIVTDNIKTVGLQRVSQYSD